MNSEIINTLAADAITVWASNHNQPCRLYVDEGLVKARKPTDRDYVDFRCLIITRFAQNAGLTSAAWKVVGSELFNLYTKEVACQAHPKP